MVDNKFKKNDIYGLTYDYLDGMININDPVFCKTIFDEKPNEEIYSYKYIIKHGINVLSTIFHKINGYTKNVNEKNTYHKFLG